MTSDALSRSLSCSEVRESRVSGGQVQVRTSEWQSFIGPIWSFSKKKRAWNISQHSAPGTQSRWHSLVFAAAHVAKDSTHNRTTILPSPSPTHHPPPLLREARKYLQLRYLPSCPGKIWKKRKKITRPCVTNVLMVLSFLFWGKNNQKSLQRLWAVGRWTFSACFSLNLCRNETF